MSRHYDLVVIGSGPAGHRAAIQGAKLGKRVAIIEKADVVGGAAVTGGTIPSKALREAVMYLTGASKRGVFGRTHHVKRHITIDDLRAVTTQVRREQLQTIQDAVDRNDIELIWGAARFDGPRKLIVESDEDPLEITGDRVVIAVGTRAARPEGVPFNDHNIVCSDTLREVTNIPKSLIVVGGGVIGTEFATIFATLGVQVTLIEGRDRLLGFVDREIIESFQHAARRAGITLRLGEKVQGIEELRDAGARPAVQATLESGKELRAETLLYCVGRQGVCGSLNLESAGLEFDDRERLDVNENFQTAVDHIYAVGDVIGFPALAATGMEQGRIAACHAFGEPAELLPHLLPYGIYAIPEISMVGSTEEQLTAAGIPYESGIGQYRDLARGQILGDDFGMLKLLVHQQDRSILGVHCIGTNATELIHIGQMVMAFNGTVDAFLDNVFNYPTLAEAYKEAAHNFVNKMEP